MTNGISILLFLSPVVFAERRHDVTAVGEAGCSQRLPWFVDNPFRTKTMSVLPISYGMFKIDKLRTSLSHFALDARCCLPALVGNMRSNIRVSDGAGGTTSLLDQIVDVAVAAIRTAPYSGDVVVFQDVTGIAWATRGALRLGWEVFAVSGQGVRQRQRLVLGRDRELGGP